MSEKTFSCPCCGKVIPYSYIAGTIAKKRPSELSADEINILYDTGRLIIDGDLMREKMNNLDEFMNLCAPGNSEASRELRRTFEKDIFDQVITIKE